MGVANIKRLVETKQLKTKQLRTAMNQAQTPYLFYDNECDELLLQFVPPETMTVVHYTTDEHVAFLYEPETMEIVGFQVEAFSTSFLPKHESMERAWSLRESGIQLANVQDLILAFDEKKQDIAQEMLNLAELFLPQNYTPKKPSRRKRVTT